MYVAASSTTEVNDLRMCQKGAIESSLQQPCRDCLFMHLLRANYQATIWNCCLYARPTLPDPSKCGRIEYEGKLDRHSLDVVATSTRCCLGIVGLHVCPFLQADKVYVHDKRNSMHRHVLQVAVMQYPATA